MYLDVYIKKAREKKLNLCLSFFVRSGPICYVHGGDD